MKMGKKETLLQEQPIPVSISISVYRNSSSRPLIIEVERKRTIMSRDDKLREIDEREEREEAFQRGAGSCGGGEGNWRWVVVVAVDLAS
ncbi:hypothetical protein Hanom_Chr12g01132011 [Helianthus anomalus]